MYSCTPQKNAVPKSILLKKFDSIASEKKMEIIKEAKEDLDKRRAIELKPLIDSFLKKKEIIIDTLSLK